MRLDNLEDFMSDSKELINERIDQAINVMSKTKEYKKVYEKFSNIFERLKDEHGSDIEKLYDNTCSVKDLESEYIYMKGFVDGITIREHFGKH